MNRILTFLGIILLLSVVSLFSDCNNDATNNGSSSDDTSLKCVGQQLLKAKLKDPGSLEIISERLVRPGKNGGAIGYECQYRAKNSFGGYVVDTFYTEGR